MRTLTKEILIAVAALIFFGLLSSTYAAGAKKSRTAAQGSTYLELYVKQGPKRCRLPQGDLTFQTALSLGPEKSGLYGIPSPPKTRLDIKPIEILVFDPEGAAATMRLAKLARIDAAPAHSFDLQTSKVEPGIFEKIYQVKYDAAVPINLWCVESNIHLQVSPLAKKPGWYRAVPEQELEAGVYAVNFGCVDGPRVYVGDLNFYPFVLAQAPPPPVCKPVRRAKRRRVPPPPPAAVACPPVPKAPAASPAPPPAAKQMDAGFNYVAVPSPEGRREYQITNTNPVPWHNVNISVYMRDNQFPATVLGPVTLYKDIVLPEHTVSQVPDKTMLQYETLSDKGAKLYLKIKCKEGVIKKAWKNVDLGDSGPAELVEVPWDLPE